MELMFSSAPSRQIMHCGEFDRLDEAETIINQQVNRIVRAQNRYKCFALVSLSYTRETSLVAIRSGCMWAGLVGRLREGIEGLGAGGDRALGRPSAAEVERQGSESSVALCLSKGS